MELQKKLKILSDAAKYDVSCSSSGSSRKNIKGGIGNGASCGICHSWADDGRCISLLKILLTNYCTYDCAYCVNRISNDVPRATFTPSEVANLTINFYKRNYIEGLFLSSSIIKNPNYTMELLYESVRLLREKYLFNGYIHIKAIPGADLGIIEATGRMVDRMSVNIELPSNNSLKLLAPEKEKESILKPMGFITSKITEKKEERKLIKKVPSFVPAGQSTQMIVGASPENDLSIIRLSENLYQHYKLKRVYYSAYVPINSSNSNLPAINNPPLLREHRLYQADWLLRFYGFNAEDLLDEKTPNFDIKLDPKANWALNNIHLFPIEVNKADYETLLRVLGIGIRSAQKIIRARKVTSLGYDDLKKLKIVLKRAKFFITCKGKYNGGLDINDNLIRYALTDNVKTYDNNPKWEQISLFPMIDKVPTISDNLMSITGER
ncbi:putative DNA modification/repair radical SAM protein [Herbivorax sp. ANBcel31]|uniref:putative DNA modification/repair radical SAM protein n=1 Tax=Herbivorax sp. ANBcel31 TaxID=3069754 RepID=UPI0027B12132|nr:putative DNA modification/repair radical SAM protein [Herbivorax sp. ANBcel31]MDQ2087484.1 putative DNA modification/repair radical SAM protein [Herbivorax sp. ANBcel31]